jgi:fructoselysine 6-kinase
MKVVCVGDCGVDHYKPSGTVLPGGITANFARQARRSFPANDEIHVISATGTDGESAKLARGALLDETGIVCHFDELDGSTPVQYIEIEDDGEKNFVEYDEGILAQFRVEHRHFDLINTADLLVTPVFRQIHAMFDSVLAAPTEAIVAVDFADFATHPDFDHLEEHVVRIDVAFFGLQPEQRTYIDRLADVALNTDTLIVVTLGAVGSLAFEGENIFRCNALPVDEVRDTTGAGDAFAAAFLSRYLHEETVPSSLAAGAEMAAQIVQHVGAVADRYPD